MNPISNWDWFQVGVGSLVIILALGQLLGTWGWILGLGIAFVLYALFSFFQSIKTLLAMMVVYSELTHSGRSE